MKNVSIFLLFILFVLSLHAVGADLCVCPENTLLTHLGTHKGCPYSMRSQILSGVEG